MIFKGDGGGGDNWSYKTCKAPIKSSPSTNQQPDFYRPDALPVAQPTAKVPEYWKYSSGKKTSGILFYKRSGK